MDNPALRSFAQVLIQIGAKYGNVDIDTVLYGRKTVFNKMEKCQQEIKVQVLESLKYNAVSFCTDMTTDDINKNSYSDLTVFWIDDQWKLRHSMYKCEVFPEKTHGQKHKKIY